MQRQRLNKCCAKNNLFGGRDIEKENGLELKKAKFNDDVYTRSTYPYSMNKENNMGTFQQRFEAGEQVNFVLMN